MNDFVTIGPEGYLGMYVGKLVGWKRTLKRLYSESRGGRLQGCKTAYYEYEVRPEL